jgi:hypothetical protein
LFSLFFILLNSNSLCFPDDHRIWDYVHDTFVHIGAFLLSFLSSSLSLTHFLHSADPLSEFSPQSLPISRPPFNEPSAFEKPYPIYPLSESMNTLLPTAPTSQHEEFLKKFHPPHEDSMTLFHSTESESANEKMRYLQQEYEVIYPCLPYLSFSLISILSALPPWSCDSTSLCLLALALCCRISLSLNSQIKDCIMRN